MSDFDWRVREGSSWPPRGRPAAPYGPAAVEVLRSCPLRLCFERSRGYERKMSFDGRIGIAFHRTLESLAQRPPPAESARDAAAETRTLFAREMRLQEQQASSRPRERWLPRGEARVHQAVEALIAAARHVYGTARDSRRTGSSAWPTDASPAGEPRSGEAESEVEVDVRGRNGLFAGRVDRAEQTAVGTRLIEYKSARRDDLPERYERQVQLYAALWRETRGEYPVEAHVTYPLTGAIHPVSVEPEVCESVAEESVELIRTVERTRSPFDLGRPGTVCKVCEFRPWCKPFWTSQKTTTRPTEALERASLGFEGLVESIRKVNQYWKLRIQWSGSLVEITAPIERFPHLSDVRAGDRLRVLDSRLRGLRHRPKAILGDYTEIFIVE